MAELAVCTYDNGDTGCRERWVNGKWQHSIHKEKLLPGSISFVPGTIIGDYKARKAPKCVYDNPTNNHRELWIDKKLDCHLTRDDLELSLSDDKQSPLIIGGISVADKPFTQGNFYGDIAALPLDVHGPATAENIWCVYDNPVTEHREYWVNGDLISYISAGSCWSNAKGDFHTVPNLQPFHPGRTTGNPLALPIHASGAPPRAIDTQVGGDHYKKLGDYQPWLVLKAWLTPEEYRGYMKGTALAYLAREQQKGGNQDIEKATHTLEALLEVLNHE